jgi:hypothetical protein
MEAAIFGFLTGAFLSGYTCFHIGIETEKDNSSKAVSRATITAYEKMLINSATKREIK